MGSVVQLALDIEWLSPVPVLFNGRCDWPISGPKSGLDYLTKILPSSEQPKRVAAVTACRLAMLGEIDVAIARACFEAAYVEWGGLAVAGLVALPQVCDLPFPD